MRINEKMIDFQLKLLNEKLNLKNAEVIYYHAYNYYNIAIKLKSTAEITIQTGLTKKEVYQCLYTFNELIHQKRRLENENL